MDDGLVPVRPETQGGSSARQVSGVRRVAIIEDHALVRDGLAAAASAVPGVGIVLESDVLADLSALTPAPHLVLLDMDLNGKEVTPDEVVGIVSRGSRVLIVSAMANPALVRSVMGTGVAGFVPKREGTAELLGQAISEALAGGYWTTPALAAILSNDTRPDKPDLSDQEERALVLYASGLKLSSVARRMDISAHTVKTYLDRVRAKYAAAGRDVRHKTGLYRAALEDGFLGEADAAP